jgi:hypothetical protein
MSVAGILSSALVGIGSQLLQSRRQQVGKEFQQLGQDLQSGNLSAAQSDFATLQQLRPQASTSASAQSSSPLSQDFAQLSADLKAGNLTAAQQDFTRIQKDIRTQPPTVQEHHHRHGGGNESGAMSQLFSQLGQALQSGNLATAQQAYAAMQQQFQQSTQTVGPLPPTMDSSTGGISVSA